MSWERYFSFSRIIVEYNKKRLVYGRVCISYGVVHSFDLGSMVSITNFQFILTTHIHALADICRLLQHPGCPRPSSLISLGPFTVHAVTRSYVYSDRSVSWSDGRSVSQSIHPSFSLCMPKFIAQKGQSNSYRYFGPKTYIKQSY